MATKLQPSRKDFNQDSQLPQIIGELLLFTSCKTELKALTKTLFKMLNKKKTKKKLLLYVTPTSLGDKILSFIRIMPSCHTPSMLLELLLHMCGVRYSFKATPNKTFFFFKFLFKIRVFFSFFFCQKSTER